MFFEHNDVLLRPGKPLCILSRISLGVVRIIRGNIVTQLNHLFRHRTTILYRYVYCSKQLHRNIYMYFIVLNNHITGKWEENEARRVTRKSFVCMSKSRPQSRK